MKTKNTKMQLQTVSFTTKLFLISYLAKRAKKIKTKVERADEIDSLLLEMLAKKESDGEAFGRTVAIALDEMQAKPRMQAKIEIQQVLLKYVE